ncbi:PDZ and LIM domain protein 5 isoform X1 [Cyanistes caeruleus]|uniref:PDZ and LIM domain protein 5 isoform X1 n=1 Tax=Cyanistes caeruleus TaxID=156563 RepID=UPI000CDA6D7B|nr:PDZ and LIM domain protein 5 isoform X1 [Cyanistes caeruleus]XP_023782767.1 PDZ and LIM domain protein 5 isoform X1 [Cyanistes caeruleus]XP_023782768.1 PDZ and LIM domain protein 5 isoform X1 [Cyanistes caeruleus]
MSNYSVSLVGPAPWGFRLQGGKDFNVPLSISRLNDGGKAAQAHVGIGDVVLTIDGISTDGMTHLEAQNKIKACTGNLNMTLQRVSSIQKPDHFHVTKHGAAPSASAADGAQDAAEGPRRGGRENQGESKQQNGKNPPKRPPRKHIVDTYTEFYHTPTHSDASKKRLIEDTEDWHPRTGTTQSRSFRILAQITGTDHMKEPENDAGKKTKKRQTENGDFSGNNASPEPAAALLPIADSHPGSVPSPKLSEHIAAPVPAREITVPAPDAASSFPADEAPPVPKMCAVATQTIEFPLPADPAGGLPPPALHVGTALGLPPALARHEASLLTCETNPFNKISSFQSKSSVSHTSICTAKVMLEDPSGNLPILGPSPPPVLSPFEQRSKIKSMAAAAVSAAIAVRARLHEPSAYRSLLDALLITPVAKPPLQATAPSRKSTSALELPKSQSDSLEAAQPAPVRSVPSCQDNVDVRPAPANTTPAAVLKPTAPLGSAKGWQPPNQAAPVSGWASNSIKSPGTTAPSEKPATTPQLNEQDTLVQRAEHIPAGKRTPMCAHCNQVIRGPFLVALGKSWHPEEFNCAHCKTSMAYIGFVEEKGMLYCEVCYEKFFAPECSKCQRKILGEVINALKQTWHVSCFVCVACHNPIRNNVFHLEDGDPYCETDYYALFGTMCHGCEFPIEAGDRFLEALGHTWHDTCFVCSVCSDSLEGQTFFSKKDKPLCKKHAHSINI